MCRTSKTWLCAGAEMDAVQPLIARFSAMGTRERCLSTPMSAVVAARAAGADRVELYTEPYAHACARSGT